MTRLRQFVLLTATTIVFFVVAVLFSRAFVTLYRLIQQVVENLGVEKLLDYALATGLMGFLLVLLFFTVRWLITTKLRAAGVGFSRNVQSVMVYINGGWQPALLIERAVSGAHVVYVPHVSNTRSGSIYVVESFQVTPLNISTHDMEEIIWNAGKGLSGHTEKLFEMG